MSHDPFEARDGMCVNPSAEPAIARIIDARLSRRTVLKGMAAGGAFGLFGCAHDRLASQTGGGRLGAARPSPRSDAPLTTSITSRPDTTRRC